MRVQSLPFSVPRFLFIYLYNLFFAYFSLPLSLSFLLCQIANSISMIMKWVNSFFFTADVYKVLPTQLYFLEHFVWALFVMISVHVICTNITGAKMQNISLEHQFLLDELKVGFLEKTIIWSKKKIFRLVYFLMQLIERCSIGVFLSACLWDRNVFFRLCIANQINRTERGDKSQ